MLNKDNISYYNNLSVDIYFVNLGSNGENAFGGVRW